MQMKQDYLSNARERTIFIHALHIAACWDREFIHDRVIGMIIKLYCWSRDKCLILQLLASLSPLPPNPPFPHTLSTSPTLHFSPTAPVAFT